MSSAKILLFCLIIITSWTDRFIKEVDKMTEEKTKEIMEI